MPYLLDGDMPSTEEGSRCFKQMSQYLPVIVYRIWWLDGGSLYCIFAYFDESPGPEAHFILLLLLLGAYLNKL